MTEQTELIDAVATLTNSLGALSGRLDTQQDVIDRIDQQRKGLHSTRIVLGCAVIGLMLDLALTVGFGFLFRQVDANTHRVQDVQARTSSEILCPLYQVFALSIKVNPPPPNYTPEQLELRQHAADAIIAGLDKLGCA